MAGGFFYFLHESCTLDSLWQGPPVDIFYVKEDGMFINFNNNPRGSRVGDCVIRAISTAMNMEWEDVYMDLADRGLEFGDMPSSNHVWGSYLIDSGYVREVIPYTCPDCYTVKDFCKDHPNGRYVLGTGSHAVAVIDGNYIDSWDSGDEVPVFYFRKEE